MSGQEPSENGQVAGVIAPPPLIFLAALLIGFALEFVWPRPFAPEWARIVLGPALILLAIGFAYAGKREFELAGTAVKPWVPSSAIVTAGPYRISRNPMYLSMAVLIVGVALAADSLWLLAVTVGFVGIMQRGVILREEAYLERRFGTVYTDYKARVRRWI